MAKKHYKTHLVYVLSIDNGDMFYIGSHNGNREYTEYGILSQSGNILQREAVKTRDWDTYYSRVKLFSVEEYDTQEEALEREQELITMMFETLSEEHILNRGKTCNKPSHQYSYKHDEEWKTRYSRSMRKPKSSSSRMGRKAA